jgi:hypothetical protein
MLPEDGCETGTCSSNFIVNFNVNFNVVLSKIYSASVGENKKGFDNINRLFL